MNRRMCQKFLKTYEPGSKSLVGLNLGPLISKSCAVTDDPQGLLC